MAREGPGASLPRQATPTIAGSAAAKRGGSARLQNCLSVLPTPAPARALQSAYRSSSSISPPQTLLTRYSTPSAVSLVGKLSATPMIGGPAGSSPVGSGGRSSPRLTSAG